MRDKNAERTRNPNKTYMYKKAETSTTRRFGALGRYTVW